MQTLFFFFSPATSEPRIQTNKLFQFTFSEKKKKNLGVDVSSLFLQGVVWVSVRYLPVLLAFFNLKSDILQVLHTERSEMLVRIIFGLRGTNRSKRRNYSLIG